MSAVSGSLLSRIGRANRRLDFDGARGFYLRADTMGIIATVPEVLDGDR